jgi:periplasmic protein TonB
MTAAANAAAIDRGDVGRWAASAALVLALHAAAAVMLTRWHEPVEGDEGTAAVVVDLSPYLGPQIESANDIAPGPLQQQFQPVPQPEPEKPEAKVEEKIEPPQPAPAPEVVLPPEPAKPVEKPKEEPQPPAPETTAPPRPRPSAAAVASWHRKIVLQIERHKGYPAAAQARRQTGVAQLGFTIDRQGRVVANRIVRSSGHAALDQETIATVRRAQPFPPPPPNLPGETFEFTVPIRFNIR